MVESFDFAPAFTFALLLTITLVTGKPPINTGNRVTNTLCK